MAKYSTGGSGSAGSGDACELCGREDRNLSRESVAGAELLVCSECAPHGDDDDDGREDRGEDRGEREPDPGKRAAQNAARVYDASQGNPDWVEDKTEYEDDQLPYLVSDYGPRAERARQDAGLTVEELASELDLTEDEVLAVEQGRAARANVGGSVVASMESFLETELIDE